MQKRTLWITALVLIAILIVLVAYTLFAGIRPEPLSKKEPSSEEEPLPTSVPLWQFEGSDVIEITVTKGELTTAVVRSGSEWRMAVPEAGTADSTRLNSLADQVAGMTFSRAISDIDDPAAFGLGEPEARVMLVLSDGTAIDVSIGAEDPGRIARYVQRQGDPLIYLVPSSHVEGLLRLVDEPPYLPASDASQLSPLETPMFISPLSPSKTPTAVVPTATATSPADTPTPKATPPPRATLTPSM
jgi:hypothetical protein